MNVDADRESGGPLVTVAIAAFNAGRFLRPSVESILSQTYQNLEVFVVDDGSTDSSLDSLARIGDRRLQILSQPNQGKAVALNRVMDAAGGTFLALQDADDISWPQRIERQVACLESQPDLAACLTQHDLIVKDRHFAARHEALEREDCARIVEQFGLPAMDPTLMCRLSVVGDLRFAPELRIGQGTDFILRVGERHPIVVLGDCVYSYRVDLSSTTRRDPQSTARYVDLVRQRACQRRALPFDDIHSRAAGRRPRNAGQHAFIGQVINATLDDLLAGRRAAAFRTALACARVRPGSLSSYKALVYAVAPRRLVLRKRPDRSGP